MLAQRCHAKTRFAECDQFFARWSASYRPYRQIFDSIPQRDFCGIYQNRSVSSSVGPLPKSPWNGRHQRMFLHFCAVASPISSVPGNRSTAECRQSSGNTTRHSVPLSHSLRVISAVLFSSNAVRAIRLVAWQCIMTRSLPQALMRVRSGEENAPEFRGGCHVVG